jgi:hypothetical protein
MIRKGLRPGFKPAIDLPGDQDSFRRVMPFRRSWIAILILAAMDAVFIFPAITAFIQAMNEWKRFESLFDLVGALFLSAWLLGWSTAPLLMTGILLMMLFGREVLKAGPGAVEIFLGLPYVGLVSRYDVTRMRNLRFERPLKKSGTSWRGTHLLFDYGANTIAVGSDIGADEVATLRNQLQMATGAEIRRGEATAEELQPRWEPDEEKTPELPRALAASDSDPLSLTSTSSLVLIIANLIPVAGSVFLGWNLSDVMVLYWAESAVIGFFNICKIVVIGRWSALLFGPFFVGHFGAFMAVHFLFIYTIFVQQPWTGMDSDGSLADVALLFIALWPALVALFISHAFSFFNNFLRRQEYRGRTVNDQMSEPYGRIIFMQFVLILGGGITMALGSPTIVLLIVIGLKIYFDLKAHLKQHRGSV